MADRRSLNRPSWRALAVLLALVVAGHGIALLWVSRLQAQAAALVQLMPEPVYTRLVEQQAVQEPPAVALPVPPPARPTARVRTELPSAPQRPASAPVVAPAADPAPAPVVVQEPPPAAQEPAPGIPSAAALALERSAPPAPLPVAGDDWPPDTRLRYRLSGNYRGTISGNARVLWTRQDTQYQVRVEIRIPPLVQVTMTSQGEVGTVLQPRLYEEVTDTVRARRRGLRLGETTLQLDGGETLPRPEGVQDTASQFVELSHRFSTGRETLQVGRPVTLWLARPNQLAQWTYDVVGRETLDTGLGPVEAFHLVPRPIPNPRGPIKAELWFAPTLQYLPVRIRITLGDEADLDLMVEAVEQR